MPLIRAELLRKHQLLRPVLIHDPSQVLYSPFDKDDGSWARDRSGYNNRGTVFGATRVTGKVGGALGFDGVDDYVGVPHSPNLTPPDALTIAFWMKGESKAGYQALVQKHPWYGYVTRYASATALVEFFLRFSDDTTAAFSTGGVSVGEWHHIVWTFDKALPSGNMKCYVDTVMNSYDAGAGKSLKTTTEPVTIGSGVDVYYLGVIDEVRIYNRALSAAEIVRVMNLRGI